MKTQPLDSWANNPCYYVAAQYQGRTALLLGPFRNKSDADKYVSRSTSTSRNRFAELLNYCGHVDSAAVQYNYGVVKMTDGWRTGRFNEQFGIVS